MNFLPILFNFIFGIKRTFRPEWLTRDETYRIKNLLGMSVYNFGTAEVTVFGFPLRPYDEDRGPDVYVLDTIPVSFENELEIPIKFTGAGTKKAYITYSALTKCKK